MTRRLRSTGRTLAYYAEHPQAFEEQVQARDEAEADREATRQDDLADAAHARQEWLEQIAAERNAA